MKLSKPTFNATTKTVLDIFAKVQIGRVCIGVGDPIIPWAASDLRDPKDYIFIAYNYIVTQSSKNRKRPNLVRDRRLKTVWNALVGAGIVADGTPLYFRRITTHLLQRGSYVFDREIREWRFTNIHDGNFGRKELHVLGSKGDSPGLPIYWGGNYDSSRDLSIRERKV